MSVIFKSYISLLIMLMIVGGCLQKESCTNKSKYEEIVHTEDSLAFPVVKWNNQIYRITNINVDTIKEKIGEIQHSSTEEMMNTPDNYSSYFRKGTTLWAIKGVKISNAIAIKGGDNYIKAIAE
ncbi:hypothetical protein WKH57_27005 [Niallia taxi]|uniref:hypothetical protein n=1 Tax=Niallia taxi TaxID=2499688 RepID=UPI0015F744BF|nr:hypothetical protein [Niallia taxi]MCM3213076.1 hypothetical protein [Niallia taxi]